MEIGGENTYLLLGTSEKMFDAESNTSKDKILHGGLLELLEETVLRRTGSVTSKNSRIHVTWKP